MGLSIGSYASVTCPFALQFPVQPREFSYPRASTGSRSVAPGRRLSRLTGFQPDNVLPHESLVPGGQSVLADDLPDGNLANLVTTDIEIEGGESPCHSRQTT